MRGADVVETLDQLAVEEPLEIRLGGIAFTVTMRKAGDDEDLVAGPLHSEVFIHKPDNLDVIVRYRAQTPRRTPAAWSTYLLKGDVEGDQRRRVGAPRSLCPLAESRAVFTTPVRADRLGVSYCLSPSPR